jgi:2-polyprenyl-3-methyl-5-hydroxy-6-metoxy-1,4-benzoquinol methylase
VDPDSIFQVLLGYRSASTLRAAIELDCFSAIAAGKRTAGAISASRGGTERSIRILLDALCAIAPTLLRKAGGRYGLTPLSRRFLVRSSREFVGRLMPLYGHRLMWDAFYDLPRAVRSGTSVQPQNAHTPRQPFWEDFARATAEDAVPKAEAMVRLLRKVPAGCEILDVGCGSGAYGATFARRIPGSKLTLFDQPNVLRTTRRLVGVRARYIAGDLFTTPFGGPYDVVIASHIFHHFDRRECAGLARKMAGALKPGGRLVIQEFVPDEGRAKKAQPLLFAVTMLVWSRAGDAYTFREIRGFLREAGLGRISYHPLGQPGDVIIAAK